MKSVDIAFVTTASLSLALCGSPVAAFAEESADRNPNENASLVASGPEGEGRAGDASAFSGLSEDAYDKSDFYSGEAEAPLLAALTLRSASVAPCEVSRDMLYFGAFEGGTYDRTFDYGDGYHAMGYYQFDHRYGLKEFVVACHNYNPEKYSMFAQFADVSDVQFKSEGAIRSGGAFTALGNSLIAAWREAYAVDGEEFSRLQDGWAYESYYMPAERYLASRGIDISTRSDAVKGLCWGLSNLFGQSGWRKFVGGVSDGYDWNGVYHYVGEGYEWPGCGLHDDMTDAEFVTALCNYVVDNVAVFYAGQPEYHQGWRNRYVRELEQCLAIIERTGDTHDQPQTDTPSVDGDSSGGLDGENGQDAGAADSSGTPEFDSGFDAGSGDLSGQSDGVPHEGDVVAGGDAGGFEGGSADEGSQFDESSAVEQGDAVSGGVSEQLSSDDGGAGKGEDSVGQQPETGESGGPVVEDGVDEASRAAVRPSVDVSFDRPCVRSEIAKTNDNGGVLAIAAAAMSAFVCAAGAIAYRMTRRCC